MSTINGTDREDYLVTKGTFDVVNAGAGADTIIVGDTSEGAIVRAGDGRDEVVVRDMLTGDDYFSFIGGNGVDTARFNGDGLEIEINTNGAGHMFQVTDDQGNFFNLMEFERIFFNGVEQDLQALIDAAG